MRLGLAEVTADSQTERYRGADGIILFVREVLCVADLADYQEEILRDFVTYRRMAVRGCHGLGKTFLSAVIILWAVTVHNDRDVKVVTTAGAWRQLEKFTWPEVHKWARRADWGKLGMQVREDKELLTLSLTIGDRSAFAVASDNHQLIEGAHASLLVYVFDEAKAIPVAVWDAAEGAFSTGDCYALAISTPEEPSGRFYDIFKKREAFAEWRVRWVKIEEAIKAGRVLQSWVDARKKAWGETSTIFINRVLGDFDHSGQSNVIPLSWIELAVERGRKTGLKGQGKTSLGVDPAWTGDDSTAMARLVGNVLEAIEAVQGQDLMVTAGKIVAKLNGNSKTAAAIDTIGIGAGVFSRVREQGYKAVQSVNVATKTDITDVTGEWKFPNLRSALWWRMREAIDPNGDLKLALPDNQRLIDDLASPLFTYKSNGTIEVEPKDKIKVRLGHSPDHADAVALALYASGYAGETGGNHASVKVYDLSKWAGSR